MAKESDLLRIAVEAHAKTLNARRAVPEPATDAAEEMALERQRARD